MLKILLVLLALVSLCAEAFVGRNKNHFKNKHDFPFQNLNKERIVGGRTVDIHMHPHQVSLRFKQCQNCIRKHWCGGSIISSTIIVTAAHCVSDRMPSQFHVMAGSNQREGGDGVIRLVQEIIMHEDFHQYKKTNDIALLILASPLPLNNFTIKAIDLADGVVKNGEIATVTGWGFTDMRLRLPADLLQEVKVPIISNELCNKDYNPMRIVTDDMMCAGFRGVGRKDACKGDSGGPLSINGKLAGIVSWGFGCGSPKYPGVYARISYLRPWLLQKIAHFQWSAFVGRHRNHVKDQVDFPAQDLINRRIVGGRTVDITMHPHQISLRVKPLLCKDCGGFDHKCGGSIISSIIIVTAAHCVFDLMPSQIHVMAGSNQREGGDGVIRLVQEIIMHEDFHDYKKTNDIALLILANPLPLNNFTIKAIDLADGVVKEGEIATVTGWGVTDTGLLADFLQEVKVPIISNELCSKDYMNFITDDMMCAGFRGVGGKDSCRRDSGGPLSINGKLVGIVSWGDVCGSPKYPGVYARISYFRSWLLQKIAQFQCSVRLLNYQFGIQ